MIHHKIRSILLYVCFYYGLGALLPLSAYDNSQEQLLFKTEYGEFEITEPIIQEILCHNYMKRLNYIHQYGPCYYVTKKDEYSRFDHSLGVFLLLRRFGLPLEEQIAGLLHDISHTVFSHVADYLFEVDHHGDSYQDKIHKEFLMTIGISKILEKYGISLDAIMHKNNYFTALEQDLPNLCADRFEYNLKGGLLEGLLTQEDVQQILNDIIFENGQWVFLSVESAKKFAYVPLYLTEHVWGSAESLIIYKWTAQALKRALNISCITLDEIHYSCDDIVWNKLCASTDAELKHILDKLHNCANYIALTTIQDCDTVVRAKFRGIDPYVKIGNDIFLLSIVDSDFSTEFNRVKNLMQMGWPIKFLNHEKDI